MLLIVSLLAFSLSGCFTHTIGNPAIKSIEPESIAGLTKDQLVKKYGPYTTMATSLKGGKLSQTYTWVYAEASIGSVQSAAFAVEFDEQGNVALVTTGRP